jgi:pimeloyl-ACP methyl ester carboxylesterase
MRKVAVLVALVAVLAVMTVFYAGRVLTQPAARSVGAPPPALGARSLSIPVGTSYVAGWFAQSASPGKGAILLLHSIRADRRQMLERAKFLRAAGYSVLLIDLQAHGESPGERITMGLREAEGVNAALDFLRQALPGEKIGVIGASLGAVSLVLAKAKPAPDAVVVEAMFPTIRDAVVDRLAMRFGDAGGHVAPLLLWQLPLLLGISEEQLRPIDDLPSLGAPVFILSGAQDLHTTAAETRRLFDAAKEPKALWLIEGATHMDLHAYAPREYQTRVLAFFGRHLAGSN